MRHRSVRTALASLAGAALLLLAPGSAFAGHHESGEMKSKTETNQNMPEMMEGKKTDADEMVPAGHVDLSGTAYTERTISPEDIALESTVHMVLIQEDDVPHHLIGVRAHEGKVTLYGAVENEMQKKRALKEARKVAGDTNVEDAIEIKDIATLGKN